MDFMERMTLNSTYVFLLSAAMTSPLESTVAPPETGPFWCGLLGGGYSAGPRLS